MAQQLFYGSLYGTPLGTDSNSVVRVSGSIAGATLTVSSSVAGYLGQEAVRPGMIISSSTYSSTIVTASGATITLADSASITGQLFRISPSDGNYYVSSASFTDPNQGYDVNDITGSNDPEYITGSRVFGVQAKAVNKVGKYHQFEVTDVLYRDTASQQVGFYMAWNESGSEADTGDNIGGNLQYMTIMSLTDRFEFGTIFSRRVGNFSNLEVGADQAAYQIAIEQIDRFTTPTGSFTGSFHGEMTGSFTGSIDATGSLEGEVTGSFTGSIVAEGELTGSFTGSIDANGKLTGSFSGSGEITSADTASSADNFQVRENLTVLGDASIAGTLVADVIHTRYETSSILYSSGSTKFGDSDDDTHDVTGSLNVSGSATITGSLNVTDTVTAEDFVGIFRGALSSSAQIADEISGSFTLTSASFSTSQTNLSASISTDRTTISASFSTSQTNLSSSVSTDITSLSSSASTSREAISSSAATALTNLSASLSGDVEDVVMGVVTVESASRAERAGAAESVDTLVQDVEVTGSVSVRGTVGSSDPALIVENGVLHLVNIPSYASDAAAAAGGIPIGGIYRNGNFLIIRIA